MGSGLQNLRAIVSGRLGCAVEPRDIERAALAFVRPRDFWDAAGQSGCPFNVFREAVAAMKSMGWLNSQGSALTLTSEGVAALADSGTERRYAQLCPSCGGRGLGTEGLEEVLERFERLAAARPEPRQEWDQAYVTPDTAVARVAAMAARGDLAGRALVVLGDDDLMGIAAALTGLPSRVTVLELDSRLVDFIRDAARVESLALEVVPHDLRRPLPPELAHAFDTFFTDPPDTLPGLILFLERGLSALKGAGGAGYFGMTLIEASLRRWREVQECLVDGYKVVVTDVLRDFSLYENWEYLMASVGQDLEVAVHRPARPWYRSTLFRVEALTDSALPTPFRNSSVGGDLYLAPESLAAGGMR